MCLFDMTPMQSWGAKCGKGQLLWEDEGYLWWLCTTASFLLHSREWPGGAGLPWAGFNTWTQAVVFTAVVTWQGLDAEIQGTSCCLLEVHRKMQDSVLDAFLRSGFKVIGNWFTSAEAEVSKTVNVTNDPHTAQNKVQKWSPGDMASGRVWLHKKMCLHQLVITAWLRYSPVSVGTTHTQRPLQGKVPTTTCTRVKVNNCACFSSWELSHLYHTAFIA